MRRPLRLLAGLALLFPAPVSPAGEIQHQVRPGESASSIALDHYGRTEEGAFLLRYNDRPSTVLRVGETLKIPYCEVHVVQAGDTWSTIAQRYFGRPSIYPALAALNHLEPGRALQPGQKLVMPVASVHRLERGETLNILAERHLGDPDLFTALQVFNDIEDPRRLATGQEIRIPRMDLPLRHRPAAIKPVQIAAAAPAPAPSRPASPEPASPQPPAPQPPAPHPPAPPPPRFSGPLEAASQAYRQGDFEKARAILEAQGPQIQDRGTRQDAATYWRLLAFLEVAYDRTEAACAAFRSLEDTAGPQDLDADQVSPKIRAVARSCDAG